MSLPILTEHPNLSAVELQRLSANSPTPYLPISKAEVVLEKLSAIVTTRSSHLSRRLSPASFRTLPVSSAPQDPAPALPDLPPSFVPDLCEMLAHPSHHIAASALIMLNTLVSSPAILDPSIHVANGLISTLVASATKSIDASLETSAFNPLVALAFGIPHLKPHVIAYLGGYFSTQLSLYDIQRVLRHPDPDLIRLIAAKTPQVKDPAIVATLVAALSSSRQRSFTCTGKTVHIFELIQLLANNPHLSASSAQYVKTYLLFLLLQDRYPYSYPNAAAIQSTVNIFARLALQGAPLTDLDCTTILTCPNASPGACQVLAAVPALASNRALIETFIDSASPVIISAIMPTAPLDLWQRGLLVMVAKITSSETQEHLAKSIVNHTRADLASIFPALLDTATPMAMAILAPLFEPEDTPAVLAFFTRRRSDSARSAFLDLAEQLPASALPFFTRSALVPYFKTTDKTIKERAMKLLGRLTPAPAIHTLSCDGIA